MRTFVAITIPDEVRAALTAVVTDTPEGLRWARAEQWHLTLAFLGDVDVPAARIASLLAPTAEGPLELHLADPGRFGPGVLWTGVSSRPPDALPSRALTVRDALEAAGLPHHDQRFRPHLTLARRGRRGVSRRDVAWLAKRLPKVSWTATDIAVLHSHLVPGQPAQHEHAASARL